MFYHQSLTIWIQNFFYNWKVKEISNQIDSHYLIINQWTKKPCSTHFLHNSSSARIRITVILWILECCEITHAGIFGKYSRHYLTILIDSWLITLPGCGLSSIDKYALENLSNQFLIEFKSIHQFHTQQSFYSEWNEYLHLKGNKI
jgi:hypothetical protein